MARRNKSTRVNRPASQRATPLTPEDQAQRRKFFLWVALITLALMAFIYVFLFS